MRSFSFIPLLCFAKWKTKKMRRIQDKGVVYHKEMGEGMLFILFKLIKLLRRGVPTTDYY